MNKEVLIKKTIILGVLIFLMIVPIVTSAAPRYWNYPPFWDGRAFVDFIWEKTRRALILANYSTSLFSELYELTHRALILGNYNDTLISDLSNEVHTALLTAKYHAGVDDNSITTAKLANDAVTDEKVADGITASNYLPLTGGIITGDLFVDGSFNSGGLYVNTTTGDVGIGSFPDQDWGFSALDVSGNIVLGDYGQSSAAGGILDMADISWFSHYPERIYTLNGLRSDGDILIDAGKLGVRTTSPQSALHVADGQYAQFEDNNAGAPPAADCDVDTERGRISIDTTNNRLYVCNGATRGWDYVALAD